MKTSIATVCISGTLVDKLHACAAAGFDGVEVFEPDLIAAPESPEEIRALASRLGLSLDLYQPMRDVEGVDEEEFVRVLRRARAKFELMSRLGIDLVLCCSNVATATIDDDAVSAAQLRRLGDLAGEYGIRIAFEALAWGRYIDDYRRAWRVVELADHPAVGVCLDSFHILSRGHDPAAIEGIPGDRIFFVQLADAPALTLDVLSWSRHHRLFPGEGTFDLAGFVTHILRAGYAGPLSLEVFNDTFRQTDVRATALHARRSLRWLEDAVSRRTGLRHPAGAAPLPEPGSPTGFDFVEIKAEDTSAIEVLLAQLGFTARGRHRTKPVTLWSAGQARVVLNEQHATGRQPHLAALGLTVPHPRQLAERVQELGTPSVFRRTYATEQALDGVRAPDGTEIFWVGPTTDEPVWTTEFEHGLPDDPGAGEFGVQAIDHVSLTQPWESIDEAVLLLGAVFSLESTSATDVASPQGLVQSRVMTSGDGSVRIPLNVAPTSFTRPGGGRGLPQHIAFRCDDARALARFARERGLGVLRIPDNYYEDLGARFDLPPSELMELRALGIVYDRDGQGEYLQFYTHIVGQVFLEFVERRQGYDGYGAGNAPVRLTAQGAGREDT
jgi:4-hydroxyphenylpyruvate dioxygenase